MQVQVFFSSPFPWYCKKLQEEEEEEEELCITATELSQLYQKSPDTGREIPEVGRLCPQNKIVLNLWLESCFYGFIFTYNTKHDF